MSSRAAPSRRPRSPSRSRARQSASGHLQTATGISASSPLVSDVGPSPPQHFSGSWLAAAAAILVATTPTIFTLGALRCLQSDSPVVGTVLGLASLACVWAIGRALFAGLYPQWHPGLTLRTNLIFFYLFSVRRENALDLRNMQPKDIEAIRQRLGWGAKAMYGGLVVKEVETTDVVCSNGTPDVHILVPTATRPLFSVSAYRLEGLHGEIPPSAGHRRGAVRDVSSAAAVHPWRDARRPI